MNYTCKNKTFLITGATGFVGYHLTKKLAKNNSVYCIVRPSSNTEKLSYLGVKFIYYESLSSLESSLHGIAVDVTFHLASLFIAEHKPVQIEDLIKSNILFPTQLLEVLTTLGYKNFINTGTAWQNYTATDYDPVCLYAATKEGFEDVIKYYHNAKQLNCITLRLYDTYGPDDERKKLIWLLNNLKNTGDSLDMSPGYQRLNLVHIDNVVDAFVKAGSQLLLENTQTHNEVYGVYCDVDYSLRDIVSIYEAAHNCKLNINWGKRDYRSRELMKPQYLYPTTPAWQADIKFEDGVFKV